MRGATPVGRRPWRVSALGGLLLGFIAALPFGATAQAQPPTAVTCKDGMPLPAQALMMGGLGAPEQPDLLVTGVCKVDSSKKYFYANVNIFGGGSLDFEQPATGSPDIDFWASSIIVEANGTLEAGATAPYGTPRLSDKDDGVLTIHLYGKNQSSDDSGAPVDPAKTPGQGALCKSTLTEDTNKKPVPCGIPAKVWQNNGDSVLKGCGDAGIAKDSNCIAGLPTTVKDYFYDYGPLYGDDKCKNGGKYKLVGIEVSEPMCGKEPAAGLVGYFGYKVLAVSYGGSLMLRGYQGAAEGNLDNQHLASGNSWMRLAGDMSPGDTNLTVNGAPADRWWRAGDRHRSQIVVTTTDYLPGHSELLTISQVQGNKVTFTPPVKWFHSGKRFPIDLGDAKARLEAAGMDKNLIAKGAETRAAVALLTRSIRIVSEGDFAGQTFAEAGSEQKNCRNGAKPPDCYYFGGHTVFRQGFEKVQIQGVELVNLGQGGKLAHYPVHFHMARQVPPNTFVKDSSVNVSNTRWYVVHDTQGVTFQRDVGWKSIGHGYYLENGTEADNNFYSDIGIFARAAIDNDQNPRKVPGILASNGPGKGFPYRSDNEYPTVFWITNGWNNFQGDMAAGAGACGSAYWLVPTANSDTPDVGTFKNSDSRNHMHWADGGVVGGEPHPGYAGLQGRTDVGFEGATPLESFYGNYATSTMMSFQTTMDAPPCDGFAAAKAPASDTPTVKEIESFAPAPGGIRDDPYYPHITGAKLTTRCPVSADQTNGTRYDCNPPGNPPFHVCADGSVNPNDEAACAPTVIDHFTSSFHWAHGNVSAVWLRPVWYLVTNSVISDVQQGGITFVTGGDATRSSVISGYWSLLRDSILVGHTQPQDEMHRFASDLGPFNSFTKTSDKLECAPLTSATLPLYCLNAAEGVSLPLSGFFNNQRLENIYDGPSYRDATAYLDVSIAPCEPNGYNGAGGCIYGTRTVSGILKDPTPGSKTPCYLPNAAIAWKQPNGFFYPPAFHANNLYFGGVDIRHFVIDPLFKAFDGSTSATGDFGQAGTYLTDTDAVKAVYCLPSQADIPKYFNDFTSIDRQTELNDDDGSLTGLSNDIQTPLEPPNPLKQTISVNEDDYFTAPVETPECASNIGKNVIPANACTSPSKEAATVTAKTSPYDYVSMIIYHTPGGGWDANCTNPTCYGVPLYRQLLAGTKGADAATSTREWKHWFENGCNKDPTITKCRWPFIRMAGTDIGTRETLTVNNGTYYLDTTVPEDIQRKEVFNTQNSGTSVNEFRPGESYNVFFVYAKPTTSQTYQIYLGKDAKATDIKAIQVSLANLNDIKTLASAPWLAAQVGAKGIVNVTVDFTKLKDGTLDTVPANGLCEPHTFCKASGNSCVSALTPDDPLVKANPEITKQADAVCSQWAVKDLDAPPKGAYGFAFTIPNTGFTANATLDNPSPHRPAPEPFPPDGKDQGKPTWLVKLLGTTRPPDSAKGAQCNYPKLPGTDCPVPDWVPQ